jgi:hypothetical protein
MSLGNITQTARPFADDKGSGWYLKNDTGSTISAGAVHRIDDGGTDGWEAAAILHSTLNKQRVVCAKEDVLNAEYGRFYFEAVGITMTVVSGNFTATHGLLIDDSSNGVISAGAAFDFDNTSHFGSVNVGGTSVTSITANLYGRSDVISVT